MIWLLVLVACLIWDGTGAVLFDEDFSQGKVGDAPASMLVLGGDFTIRKAGQEQFLELTGEKVGLHAVMFGPAARDDVVVEARVLGTRKGRRAFPAFGVGLNGVSGYRLMVSPAKRQLELFKGESRVASVPFTWKHGQWTHVQLKAAKGEEGWRLSARVWAKGEKAPSKPSLVWHEKKAPLAGRATIWGAPFAGTPIRFDDLRVRRLD